MSSTNRMMRSKMVWAIMLTIALVLSGCSSSNNEESSDNAGDSKIEITLTNRAVTDGAGQTEQEIWESIIEKYEEKNPDVHVKLDLSAPKDGSAWRTWLTTSLVGGNASEIVPTKFSWTHEDLEKELLVDLTPYYEETNPYNDNKVWKDTFSDTIINQLLHPELKQYSGVSLQTVAVRIYYNLDLFTELGLEVPETWQEFMDIQEVIKEHGVVPFAMANSTPEDNHYMWVINMMSNTIIGDQLMQYDYNENGSIESNEVVAAVEEGALDLTKAPYNEYFPVVKEWSKYWPKGFNALNANQAYEMFLRGDAAMTIGGNWNLKLMEESNIRTFEYGTFPLPPLTDNTLADATGELYELGGTPDSVFAIPSSVTGEKREAAVDFLRYLSSPEVAKILGEELYFATSLKGADLPAKLKGFEFVGKPIFINLFAAGGFSTSMNTNVNKLGQLYLEDSITLEAYMEQMQTTLEESANELMETNGWSKENNYGADLAE